MVKDLVNMMGSSFLSLQALLPYLKYTRQVLIPHLGFRMANLVFKSKKRPWFHTCVVTASVCRITVHCVLPLYKANAFQY